MTRSPLSRSLVAGVLSLSLALAVGCQSSTPTLTTGAAPAPKPGAEPATPLSAIAGLTGAADINGVPFAGADVKIFRPGQAEPVAVGKTGPDGRFSIALGNVIAAGGGNVIAAGGGNVIAAGGGNVIAAGGGNVIAAGGGNVIAAGGGNVIAAGGGNVIAPGGGNLMALGAPLKVVASKDGAALAGIATAGVIAAGGGNVIAAGGGNVIAAGGGNVIAAGGGNYRVSEDGAELHLSPATTLAVIALGDRLDAALKAVETHDGRVISDALTSVLSAYNKLADTVASSLGASGGSQLVEAVTKALDANGEGQLTTAVQTQLVGAIADFKTTFTESARQLGDAIQLGTSGGGASTQNAGDGLSFGGVSAPSVGTGTTTTDGVHQSSGGSGGGGTTSPTPTPTPSPTLVSVNGQLVPATAFVPAPSPVPVRPSAKSFSAFNYAGSYLANQVYMAAQRFGVGLVSANGRFYEIGGKDAGGASAMVSEFQLSPVNIQGDNVNMLGTRTDPQSLASAVYDHGTSVADNTVYVVGGRDGSGVKATVQTLPLASLGTATAFVTSGQTLGVARAQHSLSVAAGPAATRLYAVGGEGVGGTALASVEVKTVLPTSTGWTDAGAALLSARQAHVSVVTTDNLGQPAYLYVIGGRAGNVNMDAVERSAINADGSLAGFTRPNVTFRHPKTGTNLVYAQALSDPTDNLTTNAANNRSHGRFGMSAAVIGSWLYVFGGLVDDGSGNVRPAPWVDRAPIDPATGVIGAFTPAAAQFAQGRGFYALGLCFSNPADPNTLTDALVFGGWQGTGFGVAVPFAERSVWR